MGTYMQAKNMKLASTTMVYTTIFYDVDNTAKLLAPVFLYSKYEPGKSNVLLQYNSSTWLFLATIFVASHALLCLRYVQSSMVDVCCRMCCYKKYYTEQFPFLDRFCDKQFENAVGYIPE